MSTRILLNTVRADGNAFYAGRTFDTVKESVEIAKVIDAGGVLLDPTGSPELQRAATQASQLRMRGDAETSATLVIAAEAGIVRGEIDALEGDVAAIDLRAQARPVATIAELVALVDMANGGLAYVRSLRAFFVLDAASVATADGITVVAATSGGRWFRLSIPDATWQARAAWFIDPVGGGDEAAGNTAGTAIRTWAEFARRTGFDRGASLVVATVVTLLADLPSTDPIDVEVRTPSTAIGLTVKGTTSVAGPFTVTGYASSPTTNVFPTLTATGWTATGSEGKVIRWTPPPYWNPFYSVVRKVTGANSAYVTPPTWNDESPFQMPINVGDLFHVWTLTKATLRRAATLQRTRRDFETSFAFPIAFQEIDFTGSEATIDFGPVRFDYCNLPGCTITGQVLCMVGMLRSDPKAVVTLRGADFKAVNFAVDHGGFYAKQSNVEWRYFNIEHSSANFESCNVTFIGSAGFEDMGMGGASGLTAARSYVNTESSQIFGTNTLYGIRIQACRWQRNTSGQQWYIDDNPPGQAGKVVSQGTGTFREADIPDFEPGPQGNSSPNAYYGLTLPARIYHATALAVPAATSGYIRPDGTINAIAIPWLIPKRCMLRSIMVRVSPAPVYPRTILIEITKNGVATARTVTVQGGQTQAELPGAYYPDVTFDRFDLLAVKVTTVAGSAATDVHVTVALSN